jgi:general L-amino acid transport system permease protein
MTDTVTSSGAYEPGQHPDLPPPAGSVGAVGWLRRNLFSSPFNSALTIFAVVLLYELLTGIADWFFFDAVVDAGSRVDCRKLGGGACWAVIITRADQFTFGFYPHEERWRTVLAFFLMFIALAPLLFDKTPMRRQLIWFSLAYPFIAGWLIYGGLGLRIVDSQSYGGFMLTLIIGVTGIVASLPIGVLLALGRQSRLFSIRIICVSLIEFLRGVPLITLLFVASTMLNYFLPPGTSFNLLVRVLIMVTLFASAYIAEVVRGGLQAIPRGQYEAADAAGLTYWKKTTKIILPQALRIVIPALMNDIIRAFKNTTFVSIIGLFDVLGATATALEDPLWVLYAPEAYMFIFVLYFCFCFSMSKYSEHVENDLTKGRNF